MKTIDIDAVRRAFAHGLRNAGRRSPRLLEAFATVPRERFVGAGPWKLGRITPQGRTAYEQTATAEPFEVYVDTVIAIDESRGLNNGEPSSLAEWIDALAVVPGETVVHVGAGTGYYTAILAEMTGPSGSIVAYEIDAGLTARARQNLASYANVSVRDDACCEAVRDVDAMFVNCGVTHPDADWLRRIAPHGRVLFPLTAAPRHDGMGSGAMFLASRRGEQWPVRIVSGVGIYPCVGRRDDALNRKLLAKAPADWRDVRSIRLDPHDETPSCWLHAADCCMSTRAADSEQAP